MANKKSNIGLEDLLISHLTSPNYIKDEAELKKVCQGAGFMPETDRYAVVVVNVERWSSVFSTEAEWLEITKHHFFLLRNMLHEILNRENVSVEAEKDYQMVCLVNLRQTWQDFRRDQEAALGGMMEVLETEFDVSVTISVSQAVTGIAALPEAYVQARDGLFYNNYLEKDAQMIFYEDLNDGTRMPMIRSDLMLLDKKLITRLQLGDVDGVKYVLHEMIDREFFEGSPTVKILRIRLGGLCCRILDVIGEFKEQLGDEVYYALNPVPRIAEAGTISELTNNLDEILDAVARHKNAAAQEPKPQWVDKMAVYIDDHYTDENLGLTEVSAAFGITPSYATRVFKQYTGRGIYETIQHVRLSAAKSLMGSDKTMKQIAKMVGYTSFLSMNRAFKKYEGATPSQFRGQ